MTSVILTTILGLCKLGGIVTFPTILIFSPIALLIILYYLSNGKPSKNDFRSYSTTKNSHKSTSSWYECDYDCDD